MIIPANYAQANIGFGGVAAPNGAEITLGINRELYSGSAAQLAQDILSQFQSVAIRANLTNQVLIESCLVKFGPNATGPAAVHTNPLPGTKNLVGAQPNTAWLVRKNTGFGGRTGRGRFYIPGITEASVDASGLIVPADVTSMSNALESFRLAGVAAGWVPTLLHGAGSPVQTPMPITSFSVDNLVATQRRRLRR